jgi:hypothetical protein
MIFCFTSKIYIHPLKADTFEGIWIQGNLFFLWVICVCRSWRQLVHILPTLRFLISPNCAFSCMSTLSNKFVCMLVISASDKTWSWRCGCKPSTSVHFSRIPFLFVFEHEMKSCSWHIVVDWVAFFCFSILTYVVWPYLKTHFVTCTESSSRMQARILVSVVLGI